jgi:hypothetical protein
MRRLILASTALALLSLTPVTGSATPTDRAVTAPRAPAITLVQGWWEQENRTDAADRYSHLKTSDYKRYNSAQARIDRRHTQNHTDQYDQRDKQDLAQQHRILHF